MGLIQDIIKQIRVLFKFIAKQPSQSCIVGGIFFWLIAGVFSSFYFFLAGFILIGLGAYLHKVWIDSKKK